MSPHLQLAIGEALRGRLSPRPFTFTYDGDLALVAAEVHLTYAKPEDRRDQAPPWSLLVAFRHQLPYPIRQAIGRQVTVTAHSPTATGYHFTETGLTGAPADLHDRILDRLTPQPFTIHRLAGRGMLRRHRLETVVIVAGEGPVELVAPTPSEPPTDHELKQQLGARLAGADLDPDALALAPPPDDWRRFLSSETRDLWPRLTPRDRLVAALAIAHRPRKEAR